MPMVALEVELVLELSRLLLLFLLLLSILLGQGVGWRNAVEEEFLLSVSLVQLLL